MLIFTVIVAGLILAYANGANDNFKGVATLFGSGTTSYRKALTWATVTTFLGSVTAIVFASNFSKVLAAKGWSKIFLSQTHTTLRRSLWGPGLLSC